MLVLLQVTESVYLVTSYVERWGGGFQPCFKLDSKFTGVHSALMFGSHIHRSLDDRWAACDVKKMLQGSFKIIRGDVIMAACWFPQQWQRSITDKLNQESMKTVFKLSQVQSSALQRIPLQWNDCYNEGILTSKQYCEHYCRRPLQRSYLYNSFQSPEHISPIVTPVYSPSKVRC